MIDKNMGTSIKIIITTTAVVITATTTSIMIMIIMIIIAIIIMNINANLRAIPRTSPTTPTTVTEVQETFQETAHMIQETPITGLQATCAAVLIHSVATIHGIINRDHINHHYILIIRCDLIH